MPSMGEDGPDNAEASASGGGFEDALKEIFRLDAARDDEFALFIAKRLEAIRESFAENIDWLVRMERAGLIELDPALSSSLLRLHGRLRAGDFRPTI